MSASPHWIRNNPNLYEILQVDPNATQQDIEHNYKILTYNCLKTEDKTPLFILNHSYQILKDPYKRAFYDRFGDRFIGRLSNPSESYFITRFFTGINILLLLLFAYAHIINYFFIGFTFIFKLNSNLLRLSLFIFSPVLLILVFLISKRHFDLNNLHFKRFISITVMLILNSVSMFILCGQYNIFRLISSELIFAICVIFINTENRRVFIRLSGFLLLRSILLTMYYRTDLNAFKYFIPTLIGLSLATLNKYLGIIVSVALFPTSVYIFLLNTERFVKFGLIIMSLHLFVGCGLLYNSKYILSAVILNKRFKTYIKTIGSPGMVNNDI